jgi:hypothetical protein
MKENAKIMRFPPHKRGDGRKNQDRPSDHSQVPSPNEVRTAGTHFNASDQADDLPERISTDVTSSHQVNTHLSTWDRGRIHEISTQGPSLSKSKKMIKCFLVLKSEFQSCESEISMITHERFQFTDSGIHILPRSDSRSSDCSPKFADAALNDKVLSSAADRLVDSSNWAPFSCGLFESMNHTTTIVGKQVLRFAEIDKTHLHDLFEFSGHLLLLLSPKSALIRYERKKLNLVCCVED